MIFTILVIVALTVVSGVVLLKVSSAVLVASPRLQPRVKTNAANRGSPALRQRLKEIDEYHRARGYHDTLRETSTSEDKAYTSTTVKL